MDVAMLTGSVKHTAGSLQCISWLERHRSYRYVHGQLGLTVVHRGIVYASRASLEAQAIDKGRQCVICSRYYRCCNLRNSIRCLATSTAIRTVLLCEPRGLRSGDAAHIQNTAAGRDKRPGPPSRW